MRRRSNPGTAFAVGSGMRRTACRERLDGRPLAPRLRALLLASLVVVPAVVLAWEADPGRSATETAGTDASPAEDAVRPRLPRSRAKLPAAPPGASVEAAPAEAAPAPPPRKLRCVDPAGAPLPGIAVAWRVGTAERDDATDATGVVEIEAAAGDPPTVTLYDGRDVRTVVLAAAVTEVVVGHLPRLEIVVIDGTTGDEVAVPTAELRTFCGAERATFTVPGDALRSLTLPIDDDREGDVQVRIAPPEGFATARGIDWEGRVAHRARRVRVVVPVFPTATWTVRAVDAEGRPCAGVQTDDLALASVKDAECRGAWSGEVALPLVTSGGDGLVVVPGVPRIPLATGKIALVRYPEGDSRTGGLRGTSDSLRLDAVRAGVPPDIVVRPWDGDWSGLGATGFSCWGCCGPGSRGEPAAPLRVRVLGSDGVAARGVTVRADVHHATTDAEGVATLDAVPLGLLDVVAYSHGFLPTAVQAVGGRDSEVLIQEQPPRRVRVTVVDPDGRPVPSVRVLPTCEEIPGATGTMLWAHTTVAQLVGDLELATPRTDASGAVELDVPRGLIRYDATLIGAATSRKSSDDDVRIVLSPPGGE